MNARFLSLGIGKSIVIDLPRDIKDVLVADPKIANAVVRSAQRAYIIGATVGQTNIVFFDSAGQQIAAYDIAVKRDLNGIRAAMKQILPNADIQIEGLDDGVMLSGSVSNPIEVQQAGDLAARLVGGVDKVVNSIAIRGRDQVMLKVTVAEVARTIIKQLGIDLTRQPELRHRRRELQQRQSVHGTWPHACRQLADLDFGTRHSAPHPSVSATLRAMESAGVMRTLAEPNLTAISGEVGNLPRRRRVPGPGRHIPAIRSPHVCTAQITFKKFGISLNFTPVVLSEGRISLRVMTEVSELSNDNSITLTQAVGNSLTVPSIKTRRAETTLEIPSGGSMAMAGLIQEQTKQAINGLPGAVAIAGARVAVPQPRLRQQQDRADGAGDALYRPRRRAEGSVASG